MALLFCITLEWFWEITYLTFPETALQLILRRSQF